MLLRQLAALGTGFDCASREEMDLSKTCLRHAQEIGVRQMTFDNASELEKIKATCPEGELFLRLKAQDPSALSSLSEKFGATLEEGMVLVQTATHLGLRICGVSFHVGSGASDPAAYGAVIEDARRIFDYARKLGHEMSILDLGGGFQEQSFHAVAKALSEQLAYWFRDLDVRYIAEPGRYFAKGAYTLACNVKGVRSHSSAEDSQRACKMLYLNDGVFGNFGEAAFGRLRTRPQILCHGADFFPGQQCTKVNSDSPKEYSLWGPTCDSVDCISSGCDILGPEVQPGDWLFFEDMGAYSMCSRTSFNGFGSLQETLYVGTSVG
ncbi:Ornithine decarboxylase [Taxawa tesnikishii (nom. ined.)]|nr:Ornithine decarboxylase [Dothideales sp. JES 119]